MATSSMNITRKRCLVIQPRIPPWMDLVFTCNHLGITPPPQTAHRAATASWAVTAQGCHASPPPADSTSQQTSWESHQTLHAIPCHAMSPSAQFASFPEGPPAVLPSLWQPPPWPAGAAPGQGRVLRSARQLAELAASEKMHPDRVRSYFGKLSPGISEPPTSPTYSSEIPMSCPDWGTL